MEYQQQLRGWQGAVVGVAIVGVVAYQCARRIQTVDDSARFAIGVSLTREYQGRGLKEQVQEYSKQRASGEALKEPPPSDGRSVRYLDLMRSVDGRWLVVADSDAYHYMISLLSPALPKPGR